MTKNGSILKRMRFLILLLLGIVFLFPFENTVVPSKNVLVVTEDWRPIQGTLVRQSWQNYSLESEGHEQDLKTDDGGRVTFPRRTMRASVLRRIMHPIWNILRQGIHASFGVHTDMFPLGEVTEKPIGNKTVEAHPGDLVLRLR
jgi:hypothetical protein